MLRTCRACNRDYQDEEARFCTNCGAPVDPAATVLFGADPLKKAGQSKPIPRDLATADTELPRRVHDQPEMTGSEAEDDTADRNSHSTEKLQRFGRKARKARRPDAASGADESFFDEPLVVPRRSYRGVWMAAGVVVLVIGTWTVARATSSHSVAEAATGSRVAEEVTSSNAVPQVAATPASPIPGPVSGQVTGVSGESPAHPEAEQATAAVAGKNVERSHRRREHSRQSDESPASESPSAPSSGTSLADQARAAAASLLDGKSPGTTAPPVLPSDTLPAAEQRAASGATEEPSTSESAGDQPIDPFAGDADSDSSRDKDEQPIDPFADDDKKRPAGDEEPPTGDSPIDPFAE